MDKRRATRCALNVVLISAHESRAEQGGGGDGTEISQYLAQMLYRGEHDDSLIKPCGNSGERGLSSTVGVDRFYVNEAVCYGKY